MIRSSLALLVLCTLTRAAAAQSILPTVTDLEVTGVTTDSITLTWTAPGPGTVIVIGVPDPTAPDVPVPGGGGTATVEATAYELVVSTDDPDGFGSIDLWCASPNTRVVAVGDPPLAPNSLEQATVGELEAGTDYYIGHRTLYAHYGSSELSTIVFVTTEAEPAAPTTPVVTPSFEGVDEGSDGTDGLCAVSGVAPGMAGLLALLAFAIRRR